jgi:hypothetical protein
MMFDRFRETRDNRVAKTVKFKEIHDFFIKERFITAKKFPAHCLRKLVDSAIAADIHRATE